MKTSLSKKDISLMNDATAYTLKKYKMKATWKYIPLDKSLWVVFSEATSGSTKEYNDDFDLGDYDGGGTLLNPLFEEVRQIRDILKKEAEYDHEFSFEDTINDVTACVFLDPKNSIKDLFDKSIADKYLIDVWYNESKDVDFVVFFNTVKICNRSRFYKIQTAIHEALHYVVREGRKNIHQASIDAKANILARGFLRLHSRTQSGQLKKLNQDTKEVKKRTRTSKC